MFTLAIIDNVDGSAICGFTQVEGQRRMGTVSWKVQHLIVLRNIVELFDDALRSFVDFSIVRRSMRHLSIAKASLVEIPKLLINSFE